MRGDMGADRELNAVQAGDQKLLLTRGRGVARHLAREAGPGAVGRAPFNYWRLDPEGDDGRLLRGLYDLSSLTDPRWAETTLCGRRWISMITSGGDDPVYGLRDAIVPTCRRCIAIMDKLSLEPDLNDRFPLAAQLSRTSWSSTAPPRSLAFPATIRLPCGRRSGPWCGSGPAMGWRFIRVTPWSSSSADRSTISALTGRRARLSHAGRRIVDLARPPPVRVSESGELAGPGAAAERAAAGWPGSIGRGPRDRGCHLIGNSWPGRSGNPSRRGRAPAARRAGDQLRPAVAARSSRMVSG